MLRKNRVYRTDSKKPFPLSRTKFDLFINCKRCFWLDIVKGLNQVKFAPFTLNIAVDALFKNEFDFYRASKEKHPLFIEKDLNYIPFSDSRLDDWRNNFVGVRYIDEDLNLELFGAVDDLWLNLDTNKVVVVDYKATSKAGEINISDDGWWPAYKRQMEFYQFLLINNNLEVDEVGYFLYANGLKEGFLNRNDIPMLQFDLTLLEYEGSTKWIPKKLKELKSVLSSDKIPEPTSDCDYCRYFEDRQESFRKLNYGHNLEFEFNE
tara:strand:+ start:1858 stop:2649 length:792 start_codon:yes stop_codon:yes gene_type:complete